jgi:NADH-quinone oxidoreductase subunit L
VSALIHAATMVTAGVYMVVRTSAIFSMAPLALEVMAGVGAATAIFAASIGVLQTDIKKVLAYSTISQLGYMFLACGVGAFSAGVFHLMTHAFFKGLLFLAAGSVIHAMSGEQDMLKMGGKFPRLTARCSWPRWPSREFRPSRDFSARTKFWAAPSASATCYGRWDCSRRA